MTTTSTPHRRSSIRGAIPALLLLAALLGANAAAPAHQPERQRPGRMGQPRDIGAAQFGYYYRWNPGTRGWDLHYGYHTSRYETGPAPAGMQDAEPPSVAPASTLAGIAERLYRTELLPGQGEAAVVILRLPDGSRRAVSLGRWEDIEGLDLRRGDELIVRGRPGLVGAEPVFMATEVGLGEARFGVTQPILTPRDRRGGLDWRRGEAPRDRGIQPAGRTARAPTTTARAIPAPGNTDPRVQPAAWPEHVGPPAPPEMTPDMPPDMPPDRPEIRLSGRADELAGPVQELFYTNLPGVPAEEVLVRVRFTGEPERLISLGAGLTPHQLDRIEGARWLELRGRPASIDGREVILADRISVDGYTFGVPHGPAFSGR